ncbi:uncharacterized protein LOC135142512 isoform X2 [Zophobas morio]|uniref:uncharacterized protein LOC135142512 isoform X2 n=1 Tax=Zophobas morio TaxID=2755281 RepID=UPI0030830CB6
MHYLNLLHIEVNVTKECKYIELHALKLNLTSYVIKESLKEVSCDGPPQYSAKNETITFNFKQMLKPGIYVMLLSYQGEINEIVDLAKQEGGFLKSEYQLKDKEKKYFYGSRFEPSYARKVFPCFDVPSLKARFNIQLTIPESYTALSNTPVASAVPQNGFQTVSFETTPIMSTYLVAFVFGELSCLSYPVKSSFPVKVCSVAGSTYEPLRNYTSGLVIETLSFFTNFTGQELPLQKLDVLFWERNYVAATEEWGLIGIAGSNVLGEVEIPLDEFNNKSLALVIAHEVAHQWFGNLVTMSDWKDLWLKEGFANYMGSFALTQLHKEGDYWEILDTYKERALEIDASISSQPIISDKKSLDEMHYHLSYGKAASLLRAIVDSMDPVVFQRAVRTFFKKYKYGSVTSTDWWNVLSSENEEVKYATRWFDTAGYPILYVERRNKNTLHVWQQRFLDIGENLTSETVWPIYFSVIGEGSKKPYKTLILKREQNITLPHELANSAWMKVDPNQVGFYRVSYSSSMLEALGKAAKDGALSSKNEDHVLQEAIVVSKAGHLLTHHVLSLFLDYQNTRKVAHWIGIISYLVKVDIIFGPSKENWLAYLKALFRDKFDNASWELKGIEDSEQHLLTPLLIPFLGFQNYSNLVEEALKRFNTFLSDNTSLADEFKAPVFFIAACKGTEENIKELRKISKEEWFARVALAACIEEDTKELLTYMSSLSSDELGENFMTYFYLALSPTSREVAWEMLKEDWNKTIKAFHIGWEYPIIDRVLLFATEERAKDIESFADKLKGKDEAGATLLKSVGKKVRRNFLRKKRDLQLLNQFLTKN